MTCPTTGAAVGASVRRSTTEAAMALRTYKDPDGTDWRVWRVVPDSVGFSTLGEAYRDGWLCFERVDGTDRRRLSMAHVPAEWDDLDDAQLESLRRSAEPAMRRYGAPTRAESDARGDKRPG